MQAKRFQAGPVALTTTLTTNIFNPATATGGVNGGSSAQYAMIYQMHVANKTASAATVTLYRGATAGNVAGTEICVGLSVPANSYVTLPFYPGMRFDAADFLVGGSGTTTALVITLTGELSVSG